MTDPRTLDAYDVCAWCLKPRHDSRDSLCEDCGRESEEQFYRAVMPFERARVERDAEQA